MLLVGENEFIFVIFNVNGFVFLVILCKLVVILLIWFFVVLKIFFNVRWGGINE